jgi:hypothetical protein
MTGHGIAAIASLKKAKDFVFYLHHSPALDEKLDNAQNRINLAIREISIVSDNKTCWWSTYLMLELLIILKYAVQNMFEHEFRKREDKSKPTPLEQYELCNEGFSHFIDIKVMLKPFKVA